MNGKNWGNHNFSLPNSINHFIKQGESIQSKNTAKNEATQAFELRQANRLPGNPENTNVIQVYLKLSPENGNARNFRPKIQQIGLCVYCFWANYVVFLCSAYSVWLSSISFFDILIYICFKGLENWILVVSILRDIWEP